MPARTIPETFAKFAALETNAELMRRLATRRHLVSRFRPHSGVPARSGGPAGLGAT
ncbi:MAG: hypothetical protein GY844_26485, partial [Bradyrhizobium sp.]|nr:hypothetical protein [Bradyrhizobium sp.]